MIHSLRVINDVVLLVFFIISVYSGWKCQPYKNLNLYSIIYRMSGKKSQQNAVVTLYEIVDENKLSLLLSAKGIDESLRIQLRKYYGKIDNGFVKVDYHFSKKLEDKGRLYADKSLSLQNFKKEIRHYLAREEYLDIDMVNAHPTIIYQYCKKHNIECRYLEYYVNNREDLLSKIQTRHEIDRDAAKKLIL